MTFSKKHFLLTLLPALFIISTVFGQMKMPVKWSFSTKKISDCEYELQFTGTPEATWHIYSLIAPTGDGPLPTVFNFDKSSSFKLVGKTTEPKPISKPEPAFDNAIINYFETTTTFRQKIKLLKEGPITIKGNIEGMTCNESQCIPYSPPFDFEFKLTGTAECKEDKGGVKLVPKDSPKVITPDTSSSKKLYLPVKWTFSSQKISDCEYELQMTGTPDPTFHLYSQVQDTEGPKPTAFTFEPSPSYELLGKTIEPDAIKKPEPVFGDKVVVNYYESTTTFKQRIKLLKPGEVIIKGSIDGATCNEAQCYPFMPPVDFEFIVSGTGDCTSTASSEPESDRSWLGIFIAGFFGGLAALLTPCVFPMIPMTVSFFTKRSKTKAQGRRNAFIYAASIIVIYVSLGLGVSAIFGSDSLNALSTNVWFNLFFFVLLVVFAISFFGAFEITLPSSFVNKVDSASDRGGLLGIFFMAFTLSLVSFSCTGPIIGTLLVEAASKGIGGPFWGMFGFSLALALPFGLFAAFPGWLNSLPKSGGWLNSVKVFLGFLELAFAFKFASNADLVVQAGILTREIFITLWIVIFGLLGAYLMGWFKLPHDSDIPFLSVGRMLMGLLTFAFTIYLIPGLWGAPLKLISGFPPPQFYSESPQGFGGGGGSSGTTTALPEHAHAGPNGIPAFDNYEYALEYAKKVKKPLMLDFTGWACVNCRKMEEYVWSEPEVKKRLSNDVVLVSLYVDDKRELPANEQVEVEWNGKRTLKTIGNKWSYKQATEFLANAQPQYWIVGYDGKPVQGSSDYQKGHVVEDYVKWLDSGVKEFQSRNK